MCPIEYRFKSAIRQLAPWLTWAPEAQRPLILVETSYGGNGAHQFHDITKRARTPVAIPMAPSGILGKMGRPERTHRYWADSSVYGDVMGG